MKLRNKKTGEIYTACRIIFGESIEGLEKNQWKTLEEFNEDWEDYEEPKELYWVNYDGSISHAEEGTMSFKNQKQIGNYFETKEEAEKAVEKLKAWKRLKDKGFKFEWWLSEPSSDHIEFYMDSFEWDKEATKDLGLLFESGDLEAKNE